MTKKVFLLLVVLLVNTFLILGCTSSHTTATPISQKTNAELEEMLKSFEYGSQTTSEYPFHEIISELRRRGPVAAEVAPTLAQVIAFDGSSSIMASFPLVEMGSSARTAIPYLIQNLDHPREDVRLYSTFVLGTIGSPSKCAVPKIAKLMWDSDPHIRTTAAAALSEITGMNLVDSDYRLDPTQPGMITADGDGEITNEARTWWEVSGQDADWNIESCLLQDQ